MKKWSAIIFGVMVVTFTGISEAGRAKQIDGTFFTGFPDGDGGVDSSKSGYFYVQLNGVAAKALFDQIPGEPEREQGADDGAGLVKRSGGIQCGTDLKKEHYGCAFSINAIESRIEDHPH